MSRLLCAYVAKALWSAPITTINHSSDLPVLLVWAKQNTCTVGTIIIEAPSRGAELQATALVKYY
jgi:hypothetical protein